MSDFKVRFTQQLANHISFNETSNSFVYDGSEALGAFAGKMNQIRVTFRDSAGQNYILT